MDIVYKNINELIPYEKNPRKIDDIAVEKVAESIKQFGFKVPVIISDDGVVVAGHTRIKASKILGIEEIPCVIANDLSEDQIKAFRIADNKVSEYSFWDLDLLKNELNDLGDYFTGFNPDEIMDIIGEPDDDLYSEKVVTPTYEITGDKPDVKNLLDDTKTKYLIEKIKYSSVSQEEKEFLISAARRHIVFDYSKIAEFYAHSGEEMQELMEESALVIIDYEKAIEYGFLRLNNNIDEMMEEKNEE